MVADLVDMQYYARGNKGFHYILMIIDGYAIPLKNKTAEEMVKAFKQLWKSGMPNFRLFWTDKGKVFLNKPMKELLASRNIEIYWTENEEKLSVVERWNRTIKQWMWKYFTRHRTGVYIDILPQ